MYQVASMGTDSPSLTLTDLKHIKAMSDEEIDMTFGDDNAPEQTESLRRISYNFASLHINPLPNVKNIAYPKSY